MKYVLYKFVDAETASEALLKDPSTPVHEICLKGGEQTESRDVAAIGFVVPGDREPTDAAQRRRR